MNRDLESRGRINGILFFTYSSQPTRCDANAGDKARGPLDKAYVVGEVALADESQLVQAPLVRIPQSLQHERIVLLEVGQQRAYEAPHLQLTARLVASVRRCVAANDQYIVAAAAVAAASAWRVVAAANPGHGPATPPVAALSYASGAASVAAVSSAMAWTAAMRAPSSTAAAPACCCSTPSSLLPHARHVLSLCNLTPRPIHARYICTHELKCRPVMLLRPKLINEIPEYLHHAHQTFFVQYA